MADAKLLKKSAVNQKLAADIQSDLPVQAAPGLRDAVNFDESRSSPIQRAMIRGEYL